MLLTKRCFYKFFVVPACPFNPVCCLIYGFCTHVTHHATYIIRLKLLFKITIHNNHPPLFNTICQLMCTIIDIISLVMK